MHSAMRKLVALIMGVLLVTSAASPGSGRSNNDEPLVVQLWPNSPPGDTESIGGEKATLLSDGRTQGITNVSKPTITVYRADPAKATGLGVIVCPGGGYNMLAWDHEGEQVAHWLNSIGATAVLLKYRVPRRSDTPKNEPPRQALMDAQRALSVTRGHASDWGIDPKRIGILGFSAGAHLSAWA